MKVTFIGSGDPGEDTVCEVFGLTFPQGEAVDLPEDFAFAGKLANNPAFAVVDPLDHDANGRRGGARRRASASDQ